MVSVATDMPVETGLSAFERRSATRDPVWVKGVVLTLSLGFFVLFLLLPLLAVFGEALRKGWATYLAALMLAISFFILFIINLIQAWSRGRFGYGA